MRNEDNPWDGRCGNDDRVRSTRIVLLPCRCDR